MTLPRDARLYISRLLSVTNSNSDSADHSCGRICEDQAREAKLIQSSLVPANGLVHESFELAFRFIPLLEVGGDFADFFFLPDGTVGLYLGDVVGKGLPAAMYSALVMGVLRGIHKTGTNAAEVLTRLNERLVQRPIPGRFCSTLYALFSPATRQLILSNAGMELPLLVAGNSCQELGAGGFPSGMFPQASYEEHIVQLAPGDCVLFATDGLHEFRDKEGKEFGDDHIWKIWAQCSSKSAKESVDFVLDRLLAVASRNKLHDDVTAVVLKVLPHALK